MCPLCTLLEACHCATASLQQTVERRKLWLQLERGITAEVCRFETKDSSSRDGHVSLRVPVSTFCAR